MEANTFDLLAILEKVRKALEDDSNRPDGARKVFEETIFEWSAHYAEVIDNEEGILVDPEARKHMEDSIVDLWLEYANLERRLLQWKQAVKVYESAVTDSVGEHSIKVWTEYGRFRRERKKYADAQKIYLRALEVLPACEHATIWSEFLAGVREKGLTNIETVQDLKDALSQANVAYPSPSLEADGGAAEPTAKVASEAAGNVGMTAPTASSSSSEEAGHVAPVVDQMVKEESGAQDGVKRPNALSLEHQEVPPSKKHKNENQPPTALTVEVSHTAPTPGTSNTTVSVQESLPGLLFPNEPPKVEDAYGSGLPEAFVEQVKGLLTQDYIIFDVVEAQRLLQVMKELLASKISDQLAIRHTEARTAMEIQLAQLEAAGTVAPGVLNQQRAALTTDHDAERSHMQRRIAAELSQLVVAQRALLAEAGLPGMKAAGEVKPELAQHQRGVLQTMLANMQLFRYNQKQQHLQALSDKLTAAHTGTKAEVVLSTIDTDTQSVAPVSTASGRGRGRRQAAGKQGSRTSDKVVQQQDG